MYKIIVANQAGLRNSFLEKLHGHGPKCTITSTNPFGKPSISLDKITPIALN